MRKNLVFGLIFGILAIGVSSGQMVFADPGEFEGRSGDDSNDPDYASTRGLELLEPEPIGVTFFGNGGYSADAFGAINPSGIVQAEVPAGSTVEQAYVYVPKYTSCFQSSVPITFDGIQVTLDQLATVSFLCAYRADVTSQVAAKIGNGGGITDFSVNYGGSSGGDGVALVVVYSNPNSPEVSVAILDGGQTLSGDQFLLGLAQPLDKSIQGFSATMALGIGFSNSGAGNTCGSGQISTVDVNGQRLTSCAGSYDDGQLRNGALITMGGVGDDTNNPPNPNGSGGEDDELYDISGLLNQGDTQIVVETRNPSNDDIIFLAIIELTAQASVGEICGDGIDNDEDGSIDEGCTIDDEAFCKEYDFNETDIQELEIRTSAFNGDSDWSGFVSIEDVQGYSEIGFDGTFLRNTAGGNPAAKTTLTLNNLPEHSSLDLEFLLAIIDSWDGSPPGGCCNPDEFNVLVDGVSIFKETFGFNDPSYSPPPNVEIDDGEDRGFGHWDDHAYNMANDPTFQNIPHTNSNVTIDFFASGEGWQAGNDESWALENVAVGLDDGCEVPVEPEEKKSGGGDNQWDTRPTYGISHEDRQNQVVENGFRFNTNEYMITDNHHTDFAEQEVEIGTMNSFSATVYADKKLKIQEFLFGIPNVGEAHLAELGVEVWYDRDGNIEDVIVVQQSDVIDAETVSVSHEKVKCLSTDEEAKCDTTTVSMTFLEPLQDKVMAIKAIDYALRDTRTFLNDGFDISGESLNPMLSKMIPSNERNQGLMQVTQVAKYSPYWTAEDGRMFEMNSFGSFKEINQTFERFQDTGNALTRQHSAFGGILDYEQNRATQIFDSAKLISELPDSFGYHFEMSERMSDEMKQQMLLQQEIAKAIIDEMDKQDRHY